MRESRIGEASGATLTDHPKRNAALPFASVLLAMSLSAVSQTSIATAMPRIVAELDGLDLYAWPATAYLVAAAIAAPIAGRLSDHYGRRAFFVIGLTIFIVASCLCGFSQSMIQLVASRSVQGAGGGILMANSFAAIANLFPREERGKYQGIVAAVFGLASLAGPMLGGYITDHLDWPWVFLVNAPAGILALLVLLRFPDNVPAGEDFKIDFLGMATLALAVAPTMLALSWAGARYPWASAQVLGLLASGLVMASVLVYVESRARFPIMPLEIYRNRTIVSCMAIAAIAGFCLFSTVVLMPMFFQGAMGASAGSSGQTLTAMLLGVVVGALASGQLLSRTGGHYRIQAVASTGLMTVGVWLLSTMSAHSSVTQVLLYLTVTGVGLGAALSVARVVVLDSLPMGRAGVGSATVRFYQIVGGSVGSALLGAVLTGRFSARLQATSSPSVESSALASQIPLLKNEPRVLSDPSVTDRLVAAFTQTGPEGDRLAESMVASMKSALAGAVGDALIVSAGVVALSIIAALLLPARNHLTKPE